MSQGLMMKSKASESVVTEIVNCQYIKRKGMSDGTCSKKEYK